MTLAGASAEERWQKRFFLEMTAIETQGWDTVRAEFERRCPLWGEGVRVVAETETYHGVANGVDEDGVLLVATADGMRRVMAGDLSFGDSA